MTRVLLCSHAATIIAMGRVLLGDEKERKRWVGAGTATLSKYRRERGEGGWRQELNGDASFLPGGVEREWHFGMIPADNANEDGMGVGWEDPEAPKEVPESAATGTMQTKL